MTVHVTQEERILDGWQFQSMRQRPRRRKILAGKHEFAFEHTELEELMGRTFRW